jgi:uncharacterized protein (DUF2062 family)
MKIEFKMLATLAGSLFLSLALVWLFAPILLLSDWGVEFSEGVGLLGRRAAALYAGIGVMFLLARSAEPSTARSALVKGLLVSCFMLAALGMYELWGGHATNKILLAVVIEIAFALACMSVNDGGEKSAPLDAGITPIKKRRSK